MKIKNKYLKRIVFSLLLLLLIQPINAANTISISTQSGITNGSVTLSKSSGVAGDSVTVTVTPKTGYKLKEGTLKYYANGTWTTLPNATSTSFKIPNIDATTTNKYTSNTTVKLVGGTKYDVIAQGGGGKGGHGVSATVKYSTDTNLTLKFVEDSAWVYDKTPSSTFKDSTDRAATLLVGGAGSSSYKGNNQGTYDGTSSANGSGYSNYTGATGWYDGGGYRTSYTDRYVCGTEEVCTTSSCNCVTVPGELVCTQYNPCKEYTGGNCPTGTCTVCEECSREPDKSVCDECTTCKDVDKYCEDTGYNYYYGSGSSYIASRSTNLSTNANVGYNTSSPYITVVKYNDLSVIVTAEFEQAIADYEVSHYIESLDGTKYTLHSTETFSGEIDSTIQVSNLKKDITGFTNSKASN